MSVSNGNVCRPGGDTPCVGVTCPGKAYAGRRGPPGMTVPNFGEKYDAEALFSPADAVDAQGDGLPDVPPAMVLGFQSELTDHVRERVPEPVTLIRSQHYYPVSEAVGYVPVHEWGIGAPITATVTENLVAAGAETVVMLGGGACLQPEIAPDAAILPTEAIRDEGVSHHYLPPDDPVTATPELVDALDDELSAADFDTPRGTTWTTSAMYRETLPEIRQYRDDDVVSLCMETAAIWAVCAYRGADAATVHEIGDYLDPDGWAPNVSDGRERGLPEMFDPVVDALDGYV